MKKIENKINLPKNSKIINGWKDSERIRYLFLIDSDSRIKSFITLCSGLFLSFAIIYIFKFQFLVLLIPIAVGASLAVLKKGSYGFYEIVQRDKIACKKVDSFEKKQLEGLQKISKVQAEEIIFHGDSPKYNPTKH